jgi:hypothetical protein
MRDNGTTVTVNADPALYSTSKFVVKETGTDKIAFQVDHSSPAIAGYVTNVAAKISATPTGAQNGNITALQLRTSNSRSLNEGLNVGVQGSTNLGYPTQVGIVSHVGTAPSMQGTNINNYAGYFNVSEQVSTSASVGLFVNVDLITAPAGFTAGGRYSVQLQDGTQAANKFLKSITSNGQGNWAYPIQSVQLACSDLTSVITASTTVKKAFWIAPCDGYITEVFADVDVAQTSGSIIDIDISKSGTSLFTQRVTIENSQTSSLTAILQPALSSTPRTFVKGQKYIVYVNTIGASSTARGLLVTINYERRS